MLFTNFKEKIKTQPLKFSLIAILLVMLIIIISRDIFSFKNIKSKDIDSNLPVKELSVFVQDGCIHCKNAEDFLSINKFKNVNVVYYNLKDKNSLVFFFKTVTDLNIPQEGLGTPVFVLDDKYIIGFGEKQREQLINIANNSLQNTDGQTINKIIK